MGKEKRTMTAEEALKMLQETGRIEDDIIVKDDVWMHGIHEDDVWMNGTYEDDVMMQDIYEGDVFMKGNYKCDVFMNGNYKCDVLIDGNFGGKIYTDQKLIAEIAHLAGIPVIISLKDFQKEK